MRWGVTLRLEAVRENSIDKVVEAVKIAKEQRPDLAIDGEFRVRRGAPPAVAAKKVGRESKVAGKANVVIWPDLNVGNVAVQTDPAVRTRQRVRSDASGIQQSGM